MTDVCIVIADIHSYKKLLLDLIFAFITILDNSLLIDTYTDIYVCREILIHLRE